MTSNNFDRDKSSSSTYFLDLVSEFPAIERDILEWGSDHFKMERFADYTIKQIVSGDTEELKRCFKFQENRITKMTQEVVNALNVSYCESLLLGEVAKEMPIIIKLMGPALLKAYKNYSKYYFSLGKQG